MVATLAKLIDRTGSLIAAGNAARDGRDWVAAQVAYAAALRRQPDRSGIWVQYGHVLKEAGSPGEALAAYGRADALAPERADTLFHMGYVLGLLGRAEEALAHYDRALALNPSLVAARREARALRLAMPRSAGDAPDRLRFVNLGTTGTCNASCVHCPTGKLTTAHVPRSVMPMDLFRSIIDGIAEMDLIVTDQISFGLFGDGLVDPMVVERTAYLRAKLPDVRLSVNTNGASFNPIRHAALQDTASVIALHCESLDPDDYNYLMQPLRAERVFPKFEQMLKTFPGKVNVSVPVSRRNLGDLRTIRQWFMDRGAALVTFDPLSSRCAEDRTIFDGLALDPRRIRCRPEVTEDLIVDCDGQVLTCCQDFQRIDGIGNLRTESLREVLGNVQRQTVRQLFAEGRHDELTTCSRCFGDVRGNPVYNQ